MSGFKVVVFDYDGTLFDTRPAIVHCIQRAFAVCGRPVPTLEAAAGTVRTGLPLQESFIVLDKNLRAEETGLNEIVKAYRKIYLDEGAPLTKPFVGVRDALQDIHARGTQCVVVSNKGIAAIRQSLDQSQMSSLVDLVFGDEPGLPKKPDPAIVVNHILPRYKDVVICTYDCSKFRAAQLMDILKTHPMLIIGGLLQENPFFVPPDKFLAELQQRRSYRSRAAS